MSYQALLDRLFAARRFGVVLGLDRMRELLDTLGNPHERLGRVVHVAGTNGKGSTVAMTAALAQAAGMRVATYTSPHLSTVRERIVLDGEMITEDLMVAAAARVSSAGGDELTFFEQLTAMAFVAIADAQVDVSVIEVGLGGRLDATNVIDAPIGVVTGIAMDHEAILGHTIAAIAGEKAGIFKRGQHVVLGGSGDPNATPVLIAAAERAGAASVTLVDDAAIAAVPRISLAGAHQIRNAATALAAIDALGLPRIGSALAAVHHPGRFERIGDVILDGAHNPDGAEALAALLVAEPDVTMVVAASADKDLPALLAPLLRHATRVICTRYQQDRAADPDVLAAVARALRPDLRVDTAADLATALATSTGLTVVAGSLFIVGEARVLLLGAPRDPVFVSDPAGRPSAG